MKNLIFATILLAASFANAKAAGLFTEDGVFIDGYDPVSYISENKAVKGQSKVQWEYKGSKVYFSNEKNKKAFQAEPEKYVPAYNGYCAYAMAAKGSLVEIDPKSFKVINGKTYLFYNGLFADTLKKWNKKPDQPQVDQANKNWKKHL